MVATRRASYRTLLVIAISVSVLISGMPISHALNLSVSAVVSDSGAPPLNPIVKFRGKASPNVLVHILRDGTEISSVMTDGSARFDTTLTEQPTGQHLFDLMATDSEGRSHSSMTFALKLVTGSTTIVSGVFLGPTIAVDKPSVKLGETLTFSGRTAPKSTVTLTVQSAPRNYAVTADGSGGWTKPVNSQDLGAGTHIASAEAQDTDNLISESSSAVSFSVNPLEACDGRVTADLNCDGRVNLTDFSILLFFWLQTSPSNARADINSDGRVNLTDFSIMLYQWTN